MIQDYAAEPGRKTRLFTEFFYRPKGGEEGLLHHIAGFVIITNHPVGDIEHLLLMPPDQLRERLGIALPAAGDITGIIIRNDPVLCVHGVGYLRQGVFSCQSLGIEAGLITNGI